MSSLSPKRVRELLQAAPKTRILVVGDVMLDQFIWGRVSRISPEAPVPVVEFERENFMPGGAANVARNLTSLGGQAELFGAVGKDANAGHLRALLGEQRVGCSGLTPVPGHFTATKTRIVAHQQQVVRVDRETKGELDAKATAALLRRIEALLPEADAVSVGDYGKGVVTQGLLDALKERCRAQGKWLSLDPKPVHKLDLRGLSLITPNRKEAFELAGLADSTRHPDPFADTQLMKVAEKLLAELAPALMLITLGELGMLLCQRGAKPFHIPTVAQEVFDVSGAGDTVIASFTLAIAAGASPVEAAIFSNHAAGVVVGKVGTATVSPEELLASFGGAK
ncbi:MAG TPA: D-glycero-beta-D-manno-heptose-7-phosphate kinase [Candidatus Limnocylindria bacterium]|nr:D-glycero-beta-D-manno-heptose-7-phosphate kinase [Candidatus Limnocylindria bacterium]